METRNEEPAGLGINGVIPGDGECVVSDCPVDGMPENTLMCRSHWHAVPDEAQRAVASAAGRWARGRGTLADLREAQWACVEALHPERLREVCHELGDDWRDQQIIDDLWPESVD